ncbi:hypothetical protein DMR38_05475 [Clostridium sp. AWRP]|nr:hypothetical protein [Clostridium sp. AWRP]AZV56092.1 hypothetical protein DMR38_05475 [Clostridium sp. AWRP]
MGIDPCQFYYYEHDIFYPRYPSLIKMANILKIDVKKLMDNYYLFITSPKYKNFFENLRLQNNWTYNDVENILGINPYTYREWELGAKLGRDLYIKLRKKLFELKIINKLNIKK